MPRIHLTYHLDPHTDSRYTIFIYDVELQEISAAVEGDTDAMVALKEGWELNKAAIRRGDFSSPPPPSAYAKLYEIMDRCDPNFKGTLGGQIIRYLERTLLEANER